jgi:DNA repair protein RadC
VDELMERAMARPEQDCPTSLLLHRGAESLTDAELLAILLASGRGTKSRTFSLGLELLERFGHPARLDRASLVEICSVDGISKGQAARLKAAMELGRRSLLPPSARPRLTNSKEAADYFIPKLGNKDVEHFWCALLDTRNRLIRHITVATGTVNACFIHPREVYRAAITESATGLILIHNHPSGELNPSDEDLSLTKRVMEAGAIVGIRVLDHIIVGPGGHFSFLDAGLLAE